MSPRTNCCTAKLSWDFLLLQNGRLLYWIYFRNTARLLKLRSRRRERSALFLLDKVSYNARYMKIRGVKNASFPGFGPFRLQRPVFASSVCLVCICVLLCFTPVSCVYFYLVLFSLAAVRVCFLFLYLLQLNQKAFHRLAVAFRWNAFRLFNTRIKYLYLNFNAAIIYNLLRTHDCRIWVCCFGNRLFFKPFW